MKSSYVTSLVEAHYGRDAQRFDRTVEQLIAHERGLGRVRASDILARARQRGGPVLEQLPPHVDRLVDKVRPVARRADLVLDAAQEQALDAILKERAMEDELRSHGFAPPRSILLAGPSGVGKTVLANVIAAELGESIHVIRAPAVIDSHLGSTSRHLDTVFRFIEESGGVWFIDELDSIGARRGRDDAASTDEMRRVVNTLLVSLDRVRASGALLLMATNFEGILDGALRRRVDVVIRLGLPSPSLRWDLVHTTLRGLAPDVVGSAYDRTVRASEGLSHGDVVVAAQAAGRHAVMTGLRTVDVDYLVARLYSRRPTTDATEATS